MTDIDAGQFSTLLHAYGRAEDTAGHLAALIDGDAAGRRAALEHLWSAVIHQGTPWTATPPAALAVAEILGDSRLAGAADAGLRADLLGFLAAVAKGGQASADLDQLAPQAGFDVDAAVAAALDSGAEDDIYADEVLANAVYARAVRGCREIVPALLAAATRALSDTEPTVRAAAAHTVGVCCSVRAATTEKATATRRLDALAAPAGPDERAALVLAMGEAGGAPRAYLGDPHPGVRACAALAPALADDPAATTEILAALAAPTPGSPTACRRCPAGSGSRSSPPRSPGSTAQSACFRRRWQSPRSPAGPPSATTGGHCCTPSSPAAPATRCPWLSAATSAR